MRTGDLAVQLEYAEYLGSWKMRTGDLVAQLEYAEYLGSWKMRTGDLVVQLQYAEVTCERSRTCRTKGVPALQKDIQRETCTHTQSPTHCLNTLDLALHTEHLTHNSHSNFTRDENCYPQ